MARRSKLQDVAEVWGSAQLDLDRALRKVKRGERMVTLFQTGPGQGSGDAGAVDLAKAMVDCPGEGLMALRLRGHQVGDEGADHLAKALSEVASRKLHTLDVSGNRISDFGMIQLSQALSGASESLRTLNLAGNKFGDKELARVLPPNLVELDLTGNEMGPEGLRALARVVKTHPLKELSIGENHTGDVAASYVAEAFGEDCGLSALHFTWSDLGDDGASSLAERMVYQKSLRELWLTNNRIQDAGAQALCRAMEAHGQLRLLALDKNRITDASMVDFVDALVRLDKKDMTCSFIGNSTKRFDEDSLKNLNVVAKTARTISRRSVKLETMLKFFKDFTSIGEIASQSSTTQDVVELVIKPCTERYGVCYSEFCHSFDPEYYVVHCWKTLFSDLLLAISTHASGFTQPKLDASHEQYVRRPEALLRRYFVDIFCIDQVRQFPQRHPRCETDKFDFVLKECSRRSTKLLVAMDRDHTPMARTWCLSEVCVAKLNAVPIIVSFGPIRPMPRRRKGMSFATTEISLEADGQFLKEELLQRGPGVGEKFEEDVVKPLQKQALETYKAIYGTMPKEQQEDCDWVKAQDDAREDMKMYGEKGDAGKMRTAVEDGVKAQVEDSTMEPMRRRLAQLELALVLNAEATYSLLEHIQELRRTLQAAAEEKLDDPDLIRRGRTRLAEQEAEARRLDAQKELSKSTALGQKVVQRWEQDEKTKKRTRPEVPLLDIPVVKDRKQMSGQEKKEDALRAQRVRDQQVMVKGLRLAFEEAEAAGCDLAAIDECKRVYSELRVFTAVRTTLYRLAVEQAAERLADEIQRKAEERRAVRAAEREARRRAAEENGDVFDESEEESESGQKFYTEEEEPEVDDEDPKDVEDGSVDTICTALMRGREIRGRQEVRDYGKAFLKELDQQVYLSHLMRELIYSTSQRSAGELDHVLQQVVAEGLRPKPRVVQAVQEEQERPGVRRFLDGSEKVPELQRETRKEDAQAVESEEVAAAQLRLAYLQMADAIEARDLKALLKLVPRAAAAQVEEGEVLLGWRVTRELELQEALQQQDLKEIRQRLAVARAAEVEEEVLRDAARKLATWEIREGCKLEDAKMLERAIEEGAAAGLTDKQLFMGRNSFLKLQVASLVDTEDASELRTLLRTAKEMGWPEDHQELTQPLCRLALLDLREAILGQDAELLGARMEHATKLKVHVDELKKGDYRMKVLELQSAVKDFDPERLRDAMLEAKGVGAPKELFPDAKRKLEQLHPEAYQEWMVLELEEAVIALAPDDPSALLRPILQEAMKACVDEQDLRPAEEKLVKMELNEAVTMVDHFEIERILNSAQVYGWDLAQGSVGALYRAAEDRRRELVLQERRSDCVDNLNFAVVAMDLELVSYYLKEAEELGVDNEAVQKARALYKENI